MQVKKAMDSIAEGERVEIVATDAGFARDASAWCDTTGNKLIEKHDEKGRYTVVIEKVLRLVHPFPMFRNWG